MIRALAFVCGLCLAALPSLAEPAVDRIVIPVSNIDRAAMFYTGALSELIQFLPGKGNPVWQDRDRLFLGIDHSAIAVRDTEISLAFYRNRLGLRVAGTSDNWGGEQERLSAIPGAHVRITSLRAPAGPGDRAPATLKPADGRPAPPDTSAGDLWSELIVLHARGGEQAPWMMRDPDGHALVLEPR